MCPVSVQLIELVKQRLSAATEEIVTLLERTIIAYEEETERQRTLLEQLLQPRVQLTRIKAPGQPLHIKEERDPEPPHIKEEWDPEPPHIQEVQGIITTQLWSSLKTEEVLPAPTWDTNPSPPQTQPVVACVFEAWAPLLTPTQTEEEPLAPSQTEEEPPAPSQTTVEPLAPSQTEQEPLTPSQTEEDPLAPSQTTEEPLAPSQTEQEPLTPSQTEEEPLSSFKNEEEPQALSQTKEEPLSLSETEEEPLAPSESKEEPLSHSQTEEEPLIQNEEEPHTFLCSFCNSTFKRKSLLVQHMRRHTGEWPFSCSICGKSLSRKEHLKRHIQNVHSSSKPPLVILSTLSKSQRRVGRSHFCVFCRKEFLSKYRLERHIIVHTGEKPFSCSHCERRFTQKSSLKVHLRNFHNTVTSEHENTAARPPPDSTTPAVGSAGLQRSLLHKKHLAESNTKQRLRNQSKCPTCGKFIPTTLLSRHLKIHTGEKPFSCSICGKNFSRKDALCVHMIVHSEERPFICSICGMSKKRKADMRIHMSTHHPPFLAGGTNQAPAGTSQAPAGTSLASALTSRAPAGTSLASAGTSLASALTSRAPAGTSQAPAGTSLASVLTSRAPVGTSRAPAGTSLASALTSRAPAGTSLASALTSRAPAGTSQAPAGTSLASALTSLVSALTSRAPAGTSQAPAGTSRAPAGTSQVTNGASAMANRACSKKPCPICGKFVVTLRKHLIIHSGERPFACTVCGKKFSLKHHLKRHKIRHTKTSYFSSDSHKKQNAKGFAPSLIYCRIDD